jgi:hypothetical protein
MLCIMPYNNNKDAIAGRLALVEIIVAASQVQFPDEFNYSGRKNGRYFQTILILANHIPPPRPRGTAVAVARIFPVAS